MIEDGTGGQSEVPFGFRNFAKKFQKKHFFFFFYSACWRICKETHSTPLQSVQKNSHELLASMYFRGEVIKYYLS